MPKAFLVKKKVARPPKIPTRLVSSSQGADLSRSLAPWTAGSLKCLRGETVRRTCTRIWPPNVVYSPDFQPPVCPPVKQRYCTQDINKSLTHSIPTTASPCWDKNQRENVQSIAQERPVTEDLQKKESSLSTLSSRKTFTCKHCSKVYISLGALKMHIRTHTLPCQCHVCGKSFSRPWLLQGHMRIHTGEKPYICTQCDRAFADRSNLRAHLQTHSEVKRYSCKTCTKTFSRISLLSKHEGSGCPSQR